MKARHLIPTLAVAAVAAIPGAATASAAVTQSEQVSENWSGYVASGASAFSSVSGSWVQPTADCSAGDGYSAFWVGLGGAGQQSQALEQVGTQSDCVSGGQTDYYAWYELVPSAPVKLPITISPGDHVAARVTVDGTTVTVSLSDETTGASSTKTLQMSAPDSSSAEWIAEAPSTCDESGNCQPLPLADFGTVTFTSTSATAAGHTGSISDPNWTAVPVALSGGGSGFVSDQGSSADAQPTSLSSDGSSFSVAWQSDSSAQSAGGYGGYSAGGYGGDGYSSGGYGGYGYGGYGGYRGYGGYGYY